ncbi:MAG: ISAzo13-like element transposase-related protein [Steroidobacteraceae bacterium]
MVGRHHPVSHRKVAQLPRAQHYSLQCNRKTEERANHRDRDAQLRGIGAEVRKYVREGVPIMVNDMKNCETIVHLIARTITVNRLRVTCRLDRRKYSTGRKGSAAHLRRAEFQPNTVLGE